MSASLLLIVSALGWNASTGLTSEKPVAIPQGQAQLFVDDYLIAMQNDLERTLHTPTKDFGGKRADTRSPG